MNQRNGTAISVVVPTRDRGARVVGTIRSILAGDLLPAELVIVDQSQTHDTASAVREFLTDSRFRYIRTCTSGISAARNVGVLSCSANIIANTDDDCEAHPSWLAGIARCFADHPEASMVLGNVDAAPHSSDGFVPSYRVRKTVLVRGVAQKHRVEGIGACFAFRVDLWRELGGFDECLGAGSLLRSAEETDFMIRALGTGHAVGETPEFGVVHNGFRKWADATGLIEGHLYGLGATSAKHLRMYAAPYLYVMARLAARWAWGQPIVDFEHQPAKLLRLRAFLRGFADGWRRELDSKGHFRSALAMVGGKEYS